MRCLLVLAALATALPAAAQAPQPGDLVINEIQYDPPPTQPSANEWVEVVNVTARSLDVSGLVLSDAASDASPVPAGTSLAPGGFLVLVRDADAFATAHPGVPFVALTGFPALNNGGDRPALRLGGLEIDAVPYAPSWGGADASLERVDPLGPSDAAANFATSTAEAGGTPGARNSVFSEDTTPPALVGAEALDEVSVRVTFSEPLDRASAEAPPAYAVETVGAPAVVILGTDPATVVLGFGAPLAAPRRYQLTVREVADRRGNVLAEASASFFVGEGAEASPQDLVVNEVLYDPPAADDPGEFVEILNRTAEPFDLRTFTLNDGVGEDLAVTDRAVFVEPEGYAVIVEDAARFAAVFPDVEAVEMAPWSALNNGGDAVVLKQRGVVIDSLRYAPGWGGEDASLERRDPDGPSQAAANWATTSDLRGGTPGTRNTRFEPDVTGPVWVAAAPSPDGRSVTATLDEPAAPSTLVPTAFRIDAGPLVTDVERASDPTTVRLALDAPLPPGASTLVATGLADLTGNVTERTEIAVSFTPDTSPPALASAEALDAVTVRATFTEPVTEPSATDPGAFAIEGARITAAEVLDRDGGVLAVALRLDAPLADRTLYTLAATGLVDLAGGVGERSEARFFVGEADVPGPGDVVVTEILFDPAAGSDGEYVEVLNTRDGAVFDLRAVTLDDGDGEGRALASRPAVLLPGEPLAVVRDPDVFQAAFPGVPHVASASGAIALANDGDVIVLRAGGLVLDSVAYDPGWHRAELVDASGISLERRAPTLPSSDASTWSSSLAEAGGTPSAANSVGLAALPRDRAPALTITSPFAPTRGEAATITAALATEAALVRCRIYDGGGRPVRELEPGRLVGAEATLVWDGTDDDRRPLRAGIYVVLVEAFDAEGRTADALRGVVVLARSR